MSDNKSEALIVYYSSTGFTKKYVDWIKSKLDADVCEIDDFKSCDLDSYKVLIFGSCLRGGRINDLNKFMRRAKKTKSRILVFVTGAMDMEDIKKSRVIEKNAKYIGMPQENMFYCPGGLDFERMEPIHKAMVEFYLKMVRKKGSSIEGIEKLSSADAISFDATDEKYAEPIIAAVNKIINQK